MDAGPPSDGGSDAGVDGSPSDSGGFDALVPTLDCTVLDDAPLLLGTDRRDGERAIVLAPGVDEVGAAWLVSEAVADEIRFSRIPSTVGGSVDASTLVASAGLASAPSLIRNADGSWMVAWSDTSPGNFELRSAVLESNGSLRGAPTRLTDNALRDDFATLVARPSGALVGWVQSNGVDFLPHVQVMPLDTAGAATGAANELGTLETIRLRDLSTTAVALDVRGGELHSHSVGDDGTEGSSRRLDMVGTATGGAGVAYAGTFGLAVFSGRVAGVRAEVRVIPLDMSGDRRAPVRSITPAPEQGHSASIAALAGGYAVAYRALGGSPMVRLALVSPLGDRVGIFDVAPTTEAGGDVALAVASDGRMVIAWRTEEGSAVRIEAARVECSDE